MTEPAASETEKRAEHATEDARQAKRELDDAQPEAEELLAADVEKQADVDATGDPSTESGLESDLTGPGAPMP